MFTLNSSIENRARDDNAMTVCQIHMLSKHGYCNFFGISICHQNDNFDEAIGQREAMKKAVRQLYGNITLVHQGSPTYSLQEVWNWFRQTLYNGAVTQGYIKAYVPEPEEAWDATA